MDIDRLEQLIRERRSSFRVDPEQPVQADLIRRLCESAVWAPNHRRTHPWRFAVLSGDSRLAVGVALAEDLERNDAPAEQVEKARGKFARAPVVVVVGSAGHEDPVLDEENRYAVAAGIQNMLLGATAAGLRSYWTTGRATTVEAIKRIAGFGTDVTIIGFVHFGWPVGEVPPGRREEPAIMWVGLEA